MQPDAVHKAIHHIGRARHIAHVFEKAHAREKDHQDGKKGQHRPDAADDSLDGQTANPLRCLRQRFAGPAGQRAHHGRVDPALHGPTDGIGQSEDGC